MKKSVKILIVVLCLIIVGLVTFIVVDKVINRNSQNKENVIFEEENKTNQNNNLEEYEITSNIVYSDEGKHYMVISAYNSNKELVWSFNTDAVDVPQYENLAYLGNTYASKNEKKIVYIAVDGSIIALDYQNGKKIWENKDFETVSCDLACIDNNGTLYASCAEYFKIIIIDSNGKTLKTINGHEEGFSTASGQGFWMNDISLENNETVLKVSYGEIGEDDQKEHEYTIKIDLSNYTVEKSENINIVEVDENDYVTNTTTEKQNAEDNMSLNNNSADYAKEYIKIIDKYESDYPENNITCDLIYFNNDNIPDLVIGISGYWVSLYIYENGTIYNPVDEWGYGTGGSKYYEYLEKKGAIYNYGNSYAGAIGEITLYILNSKKEFDVLSYVYEGATLESTNSMYEQVQKELAETEGYYYNGQKISEQEFNNKLKEFSVSIDEKDYKGLGGNRAAAEIKEQLQQ